MAGQLHIVGGGAVGSLVAAGAHRHGVPYMRYPRHAHQAPKTAQWLDGETFLLDSPKDKKHALSEHDVLIFPLKVYQLDAALSAWRPFLEAKPTVILMHNGMGGFELARRILSDNYPILLSTTSHGALKRVNSSNETCVVYTGKGNTHIGVSPGLSTDMAPSLSLKDVKLSNAVALLNKALPEIIEVQDIMHALWRKLAINAVINPLTALNNITNKGVAEDRFSYLRHAICEEFTQVANAYAHKFSVQDVLASVIKVAKATGNNYSSMHQDVAHNRQTEVAAINGYIVDMAKKKGINVPVNALLVEKINAL